MAVAIWIAFVVVLAFSIFCFVDALKMRRKSRAR